MKMRVLRVDLYLCCSHTPHADMSLLVRKPTFWFPTWSDTNQAVQLQKMARCLKFRFYEVEGLYYPCSKNKGADQLRGYRKADLRLCFRICKMFSHNEAHILIIWLKSYLINVKDAFQNFHYFSNQKHFDIFFEYLFS